MIRRRRSSRRTAFESYALSPRTDSGCRLGRPGRPATGGMPSTGARVLVMSLTLAAVVMTCSGVPRPSQIRWCLLPVFRRSTGDGPVAAPSFRADVGSVHTRAGPVEFAGRVQLGEQQPVELVEDSGLLPAIQPSPAGLSGAEPQLRWQELPGHIVERDVQNALQTESVRNRPRARRPLRPGRQQRFDQRPQVVVHDPRPSAHSPTDGRIITPVTLDQDSSTRSRYELYVCRQQGIPARCQPHAARVPPAQQRPPHAHARRCCAPGTLRAALAV